MGSLNKVQLIGRLGQDPELKQVGGQAVANFSVATSEKWTDKQTGEVKERTEWHRITAWRKTAELCARYLTKGREVYIEGRLQTRSWDKEDGSKGYATEVIVDNVVFLGSNPNAQASAGAAPEQFENSNDIPF